MTIQLIHADCLEVDWPQVDAIITDPPYGIKISSNPIRQKFEKQDWDDLPITDIAINKIFAHSKNQIIFGGNYFNLPPTQCFLIWDKVQPENFSSGMCEFIWTSFKSPAKMFKFNVKTYKKVHPTQKPIELMEWIIKKYTKEGDTILDPFMGSGTTGQACINTGRNFIGIEKDGKYYNIARKRLGL